MFDDIETADESADDDATRGDVIDPSAVPPDTASAHPACVPWLASAPGTAALFPAVAAEAIEDGEAAAAPPDESNESEPRLGSVPGRFVDDTGTAPIIIASAGQPQAAAATAEETDSEVGGEFDAPDAPANASPGTNGAPAGQPSNNQAHARTTTAGNAELWIPAPAVGMTAGADPNQAVQESIADPEAAPSRLGSIAQGDSFTSRDESEPGDASPSTPPDRAARAPIADAIIAAIAESSSHTVGRGDLLVRDPLADTPLASASRPAWAQARAFMTLAPAMDAAPLLAATDPGAIAGAPLTHTERASAFATIVQTVRVQVKEGVSEATVRLRPEHLGEVTIAVRVEGRTVSAIVHAESAQVREWLQSQESTLRGSLVEQGLHLERLQIHRDARQDRRDQPAPEARRTRTRRGQEPEPRFEVVA